MRFGSFLLSLAALFVLGGATAGNAAVFTVTRTDDRNSATCAAGDCSLREAVRAANASAADDTINFAQGLGTIVLADEIEITNSGTLTISGRGASSTVIDGGTGKNGIFYVRSAVVTIADVKLTGGFGGKFYTGGGAIYVYQGSLTLERVHATGNSTFGHGGVVYYDGGTGHRIRHSTFNGNTATNCGVFYNDRGTLSVVNSTFTGNMASSVGGAFCTDGTTRVRNITVTGNTADLGGGLQFGLGTFNFGNSIIAGNTATKDYQEMLIDASDIGFAGNNIIGDSPGDATNTNVPITYPPSDILNTPPRLGPLQNNGGLTPTRALLTGSPAINGGNNARAFDPHDNSPLESDQRGSARIVGGTVDIGAFELGEGAAPAGPAAFDFDGDGKTDISVFRPAAAEWWLLKSSNGSTFGAQFGASTDMIVSADFTGDGKTDIAFFRPSTGQWSILRSENSSFYGFPFGASGDIPTPADFDGDGKADPAVYRPSTGTWYILRSIDSSVTAAQFGSSGDRPVAADYDADGKADIGVFRPSGASGGAEWWIQRSSAGLFATTFGTPADKAVPGDWTGDGKADVAFFRPSSGQWFVLRSENSSFYAFPFGASGDVPAPGDYDGDRKLDAAVIRPDIGQWWILRSSSGLTSALFGIPHDVPVPGAFVR